MDTWQSGRTPASNFPELISELSVVTAVNEGLAAAGLSGINVTDVICPHPNIDGRIVLALLLAP